VNSNNNKKPSKFSPVTLLLRRSELMRKVRDPRKSPEKNKILSVTLTVDSYKIGGINNNILGIEYAPKYDV
jgi:hypothetical protein